LQVHERLRQAPPPGNISLTLWALYVWRRSLTTRSMIGRASHPNQWWRGRGAIVDGATVPMVVSGEVLSTTALRSNLRTHFEGSKT
jgi:hypothetical protein